MIYKRKRKKSFKKYLFIGHLEFLWGLRDRQAGLARLVHFNLI